MKKINYPPEKMDIVKQKVQKLIAIVKELQAEFPDRHFTLDGHLFSSIAKVMAAYYYKIELYAASDGIHDAEADSKKIQIKISQQDAITINHEPDYLIVLYLNKNGNIYEVYNGPGTIPWDNAGKKAKDSPDKRNIRVNSLMELNRLVPDNERIPAINEIVKMTPEYKNLK